MDAGEVLKWAMNTLLGGGGIVGAYFAWRGLKAKRRGLSTSEPEATVEAIEARATDSLNAYWRRELRRREAEVEKVRAELAAETRKLRQQADARAREDAARIDQLEEHIWRKLPPPPPPPPKARGTNDEHKP